MEVKPATAIQGPQLSAIRAAEPAAAADAITRLLKYVDGMFNFADHKKLNTIQAAMLANDIAQRYWQLKFDEVVYVLREGSNGRYHTFDRIDPGVIHGWFAEYQAERDELLEALAHNEAVLHRKESEQTQVAAVAFVNQHALPDAQDVTMEVKYAALALQAHDSDTLQQGLDYYRKHAHLPGAAVKIEAAGMVLDQRRLAAAREAARVEEARERARALIGEYDAATLPAPDLESEAVKHFAAAQGIPKLSDVVPRPMQVVRDTDAA